MERSADLLVPKRREKGLVVREFEQEVLVYDLERDKVHCLNPSAALVWNHCDGETTVADIVQVLRSRASTPVGTDAVWHALLQLGADHLLEQQVSRPTGLRSLSRRQMLKVGAATAVSMPVIYTIMSPTAAFAMCNTTCTNLGGCTASCSVCRKNAGAGGLCSKSTDTGCACAAM